MSFNNRSTKKEHKFDLEIVKDFFDSVSVLGAVEIGIFIIAVFGVLGFIIGAFSIIFYGLLMGFVNAFLSMIIGILIGGVILLLLVLISVIIEFITGRF